ncbi:MAG: hypothetical protein PF439_10510 [Helicobacteraceae bacterium]|jgi:hypothetical protein|nr:hypothetical protein [Helicobacteraceae bacterium]
MTEIITEIKDALTKVTTDSAFNEALVTALSDSDFLWQSDYSIALVNTTKRIEDSADIKLFEAEALVDETGLTPAHPSPLQLRAIADIGTKYLQRVSIMSLKSEHDTPPLFQVKRQNDYWRKIQDVDPIKAMVEVSSWREDVGVCDVEFSLREIIRKRKEVHALKDVGFVWIAVTSSDISEVFRHYFQENYAFVQTDKQSFHIGWSSTLQAISMRDFVCTPK